MKMRFARGISIAVGAGMVLAGSAALASGASPDVGVNWTSGKTAPFAGTRFDGAVYKGKVYFLGFRLVDNTTDGSIWTYNIETKKFADTGKDMAVPVSNYTVAVLKDANGTGLYTFGGRNNDGGDQDRQVAGQDAFRLRQPAGDRCRRCRQQGVRDGWHVVLDQRPAVRRRPVEADLDLQPDGR
jgi:hypothetical protein